MRKTRAAIGSIIFFAVAPGVVAGVVPWLLTDWRVQRPFPFWVPVRLVGLALLAIGLAALVHSFIRFVIEGSGTPAPVAPTERLVIGGLYRYVRNPMYLAVVATIVGQGVVLGRLTLLLYAVMVWVLVAGFVRIYEEPTLRRRYGAQYEAYRRAVPAWWPNLHAWKADEVL